ncbi:hypothetical protein OPV22_009785 [Ensete ventricosum]|uniref:Uncharacterized protein n=1 Tax=Ensete ventricosum TaxID=4639 RepID=A0AAV8RGP2_ENSVE|nr:hypothetical protein OPV22_009785 [Ensete ventricosum]
MGTSSKSASHHLLWDKARNRVDDLQEMFAVLEEQVHRRLRACWAELNQPSPATSLQLREEEDDAASKLAFGNTPKPEQVELQQADVGAAQGGRAANFLEAYYANRNVVGQKLLYAGYYESNLHTRPDNNGRNVFPYMSAFLRPKCALWDCPRKLVGIPVCEGAATARSPWNAPELFHLCVLEGKSLREWLFFDKPRRVFETGNRKQRLEFKLIDPKKSGKSQLTSNSLMDLQQQMGRLKAESSVDYKKNTKSRTKANQNTVLETLLLLYGWLYKTKTDDTAILLSITRNSVFLFILNVYCLSECVKLKSSEF